MRIYLDLPDPPASGGVWNFLNPSAHVALDVTDDYVSLICDSEALEQLGKQMIYLARRHKNDAGHLHIFDAVSELPCADANDGGREFILEWTFASDK